MIIDSLAISASKRNTSKDKRTVPLSCCNKIIVISNSFDNPIVKNMKYLANTVKNDNDGKEMLWIPFYADEDDENGDTQIGKRLGYMVNQTKIFNYVILQPSYYFIGTDESLLNVTRVKNCVLANTIYDRYGSTFAKVDNSYAQIGAEMECDSKITTGATITLKSGAKDRGTVLLS